jgi:hypothetical protein
MMRSPFSIGYLIGCTFAALACGCGSKDETRCTRDADCPPGEICAGVPALPTGTCQPGSRADGGAPLDGGTPEDGGAPVDGGASLDGGPVDGGASPDGSSSLPGERCETAVPVTPGTLTGQTTVGYGNDYSSAAAGNGCGLDPGPDRVYSVVLPNGKRLTASVSPEGDGGSYDPSIYLVSGPASNCSATPRVCLARDDAGGPSQRNTVSYTNRTGSDRTIFIVVDSYLAGAAGPFTLEVAVDTPPEGDSCQNAVAVSAGVLPGQSLDGFTNDYSGASSQNGCTGSDAGRDRVYSVTVPSGQRLTASITPEGDGGSFDPSIYLIAAPASNCDASPRVCLSSDDSGGASQTNVVKYTNRGASEQPVFIVVDSRATSQSGGTFSLQVVLDTPPPIVGDTCLDALALTPGTLDGQTTEEYQGDYNLPESCTGYPTPGRDRVYSVLIPAGKQLGVTVTPVGAPAWDVALYLLAGPATACATATTCLAGRDRFSEGAAETLTYTNRTGSDLSVFLVVDGASSEDRGGTYSLQVSLETPPPTPGDTCLDAVPVTPGTLSNQTTVGYQGDYALPSSCTGANTLGLDRVYSISIPAGQKLTVTVTPVLADGGSSWDPAIYLLGGQASDCASATTCLAGRDLGGGGAPETLEYTNTSGSPLPVFLVVDGYGLNDVGGPFSMTIHLGAPDGG